MTAIASDETVDAPAPRAIGPAGAYAAFALAALVALLPTVETTVRTWATSSAYHHGFLIAPLVSWLIWREQRRAERPAPVKGQRPRSDPQSKSGAGVALVLVGSCALLWLAGRTLSANIIEQFAFVSLLIAGVVLVFGAAWAKARAFPLALLYFMVPFGTSLAPLMQSFAAGAVTALLNAAGIETARNDLILATAEGRFEIAPGCAGLNFLLASIVIAAVYGAIAMRSWTKRLALIAGLAALSVFANILRIFLVIAITAWSGGGIALAADHLLFGWALYGVLLFGYLLAARRFADAESAPPQPAPMTAWSWKPLALAVAIVSLAASLEQLTAPALQWALEGLTGISGT